MNDFIQSHPLRIDLPDGNHLRFRDIISAARTASFHRLGIWDGWNQRGYSFDDAVRIMNQADSPRREF